MLHSSQTFCQTTKNETKSTLSSSTTLV